MLFLGPQSSTPVISDVEGGVAFIKPDNIDEMKDEIPELQLGVNSDEYDINCANCESGRQQHNMDKNEINFLKKQNEEKGKLVDHFKKKQRILVKQKLDLRDENVELKGELDVMKKRLKEMEDKIENEDHLKGEIETLQTKNNELEEAKTILGVEKTNLQKELEEEKKRAQDVYDEAIEYFQQKKNEAFKEPEVDHENNGGTNWNLKRQGSDVSSQVSPNKRFR